MKTLFTCVNERTSCSGTTFSDVATGGRAVLCEGDVLDWYSQWPVPITIVSDGAYGVGGFEGDPRNHITIGEWYRPHIEAWTRAATAQTTLWFWNSEIGWATTHPILEANGWDYVNCNVWNKGIGHIAGNVNTQTIRRFPVVTEVCVQYVRKVQFKRKENMSSITLQQWLYSEWKRTGLPFKQANAACGVIDAASRKYLSMTPEWYPPPTEMFLKIAAYANEHGKATDAPYFNLPGEEMSLADKWNRMRAKFTCPHGFTNVWDRPAVRGEERIKLNGKAVHPNQKPLDLMQMIIEATTDPGDVVWEPFGGLFGASVAGYQSGRVVYGSEINPKFYDVGVKRFSRQKELASLCEQVQLNSSTLRSRV